MIFMHTLSGLEELRRREADAHCQDFNRRARTANLAMCTATDSEQPIEVRIAAFQIALNTWQGDPYQIQNLKRQCPALFAIIETRNQA
jgi:hypothetical protein